jgi:hypothetical protein
MFYLDFIFKLNYHGYAQYQCHTYQKYIHQNISFHSIMAINRELKNSFSNIVNCTTFTIIIIDLHRSHRIERTDKFSNRLLWDFGDYLKKVDFLRLFAIITLKISKNYNLIFQFLFYLYCNVQLLRKQTRKWWQC